MKKTTIILALLIVFAFVLGACAAPAAPAEEPAEEPAVEEPAEEEVMEEEEVAEEPAEEEAMEEEAAFDASVPANESYDIAIVVKNFASAFWAQHVDGAEQAAIDLGINLTSHAPEKPENIEEQIAILEDLITAGGQFQAAEGLGRVVLGAEPPVAALLPQHFAGIGVEDADASLDCRLVVFCRLAGLVVDRKDEPSVPIEDFVRVERAFVDAQDLARGGVQGGQGGVEAQGRVDAIARRNKPFRQVGRYVEATLPLRAPLAPAPLGNRAFPREG